MCMYMSAAHVLTVKFRFCYFKISSDHYLFPKLNSDQSIVMNTVEKTLPITDQLTFEIRDYEAYLTILIIGSFGFLNESQYQSQLDF